MDSAWPRPRRTTITTTTTPTTTIDATTSSTIGLTTTTIPATEPVRIYFPTGQGLTPIFAQLSVNPAPTQVIAAMLDGPPPGLEARHSADPAAGTRVRPQRHQGRRRGDRRLS